MPLSYFVEGGGGKESLVFTRCKRRGYHARREDFFFYLGEKVREESFTFFGGVGKGEGETGSG